ncbi:hypothetical protein C8J56DRAFT_1078607 [Mycena floridula]|nr:hypothetical protein C8J56DRAFT_1078607 [Mycena floridula]
MTLLGIFKSGAGHISYLFCDGKHDAVMEDEATKIEHELPQSPFIALPPGTLSALLLFLDPIELAKLAQTCRSLHASIYSPGWGISRKEVWGKVEVGQGLVANEHEIDYQTLLPLIIRVRTVVPNWEQYHSFIAPPRPLRSESKEREVCTPVGAIHHDMAICLLRFQETEILKFDFAARIGLILQNIATQNSISRSLIMARVPGTPNGFGLWPSPYNYPEPNKQPMSSTAPSSFVVRTQRVPP